ncbi:glutathione S-transferase N-terminal domain-containing protein [Kangiella sp.]|uniref:glutathione S-transferase n=1 Tax=Kangiella sp. TaxID=1920245 RepID=UPI0019A8368B|nr:glutathione S-transferase N-terminal domain-containing protein [Kangiella sp.]MBD3652684.1 glutathione S-transferase N-terminal domain-containing protein [Kangiella sp.]
MKLIYSTASPYARTARIFVHELGLGEQVEEVFQHPFENPAELIEANPLCKVPCLIDDEGKAIFDSQVICEYLDALAGPRLFKEIHNDWHLKTLYSLTRGLLDSAVAWQQDKMREPGQRSEFWQERFIKSIDRGLEYFEQRLDELPKEFSAIHANLITVLEYLDFRHPGYQWQEKFNGLKNWWIAYKEKPSLVETQPKA